MIKYRVLEFDYKLSKEEMIKLYTEKRLVQNLERINDQFNGNRFKRFTIRELIFTYDYKFLVVL